VHRRIEVGTLLRNSLPERLQRFPHAPLLPCGFSTSHDARYAAIVITDGEFVVALEIGLPPRAHAIWREIAESIATCDLAWSPDASRKKRDQEKTRSTRRSGATHRRRLRRPCRDAGARGAIERIADGQ